jgi:hypothetical protein
VRPEPVLLFLFDGKKKTVWFTWHFKNYFNAFLFATENEKGEKAIPLTQLTI